MSGHKGTLLGRLGYLLGRKQAEHSLARIDRRTGAGSG